jgi:hypothetical protein
MSNKDIEQEIEQKITKAISLFRKSQSMGCWKECQADADSYLTDWIADMEFEIKKDQAQEEEAEIFRKKVGNFEDAWKEREVNL